MSKVMSSSTLIINGGMMSSLVQKTSEKTGRNYGEFSLSANDNTNVWVKVFDKKTFDFIERNARKGTQLEITGKLSRISVKEGKKTLNINAVDVRFTGNFGEKYVAKQDEKQTAGATS